MPSPRLQLAVSIFRNGQTGLALPAVPRYRHPTGQQELCVPCHKAGVDKRGVSRDGDGSPPLCYTCWHGPIQRENRRLMREATALAWEQVSDLPDLWICPECGSDESNDACWLCGYSYLEQARREFEREFAEQATEMQAQAEALAAIPYAQAKADDVRKVIERLQAAVKAFGEGKSKGRPIALLADILAQMQLARTTNRGRPPVEKLLIIALMVLDADYRSGRRSMAGRERTAWLVGCEERTVTNTWKLTEDREYAERTVKGGKLSYAERIELHRSNNRTVFDFAMLHLSPITTEQRDAQEPAALATFATLLDRLTGVYNAAVAELDRLKARAGQWTDLPEHTERAKIRTQAAQMITTIRTPTPDIDTNNFPPRLASKGEYLSSCLFWVKTTSQQSEIHSSRPGSPRPTGRRKKQSGASRSSTKGVSDLETAGTGPGRPRSQPVAHPRTADTGKSSKTPAARPDWADWAIGLALDLRKIWTWLHGIPLRWIAATLGGALGPDWTAQQVVDWVMSQRGGRPLLAEPARPASYLKDLLVKAFENNQEPPVEARLATETREAKAEARREVIAEEGARMRAKQAADREQRGDLRERTMPDLGEADALFAGLGLRVGRRRQAAPAECEWPEVPVLPQAAEARCCTSCGHVGADVEARLTPARVLLCPACTS